MNELGRKKWAIGSLMVLLMVALTACRPPQQVKKEEPKNENIIGKKTQDIVEFDPASHKVKDFSNDSYLGGAFGSAAGQIGGFPVTQALQIFQVEKERFPETHEEFMTEIIKKLKIELPMLPHGSAYAYDVANHKLVVIEADSKE